MAPSPLPFPGTTPVAPRDRPPRGAPRRVLVVANPISGRGRGAGAAREVARGLERTGAAVELFLTSARGDAFERLRRMTEPCDLVVSVGGDGTLREVLDGLVDPDVPVGMLPFGTANVLATQLRLPRDVHRAIEVLAAGRTQELDVARVGGKLSFLVTGVGVDGLAVDEVERRRSGAITKWSYVHAVLAVLRDYRPPRLAVRIDGEPLPERYGFVFVSNTRSYGGILRLDPASRLDDGLLEAYLFRRGTRGALLRGALRGALVGLPGGAVELRRLRRIEVTSDDGPVPYQVDGDPGGTTPVELVMAPNRYRLVVP